MDNVSCNICGAPIHESDVFCRKCGTKRKLAAVKKEIFLCPNCGSMPRAGARFCDMCGVDFNEPEQGEARPRVDGKRKKKGCLRVLLPLILLLGIAGAVITNWDKVKPIIADFRDYIMSREFVARYFGTFQPAESPEDISSAEQLPVVSPDPDEEILSPADEGGEEDSGGILPDIAEDTEEPIIIIAVPVPVEPDDDLPDSFVSPDSADSPDSPEPSGDLPEPIEPPDDSPESIEPSDDSPVSPDSADSPDLPEAQAEAEALPTAPEVVWTERDQDGYSFLSRGNRFTPDDETLSIPGVVSADRVRVRNMPSTERGRILRQLNTGVQVDVTRRFASGGERYYWFQILHAGEIGWVYGEFLRVESTDNEVGEITLQNE